MKIKQLRDIAKEKGVRTGKMTKTALIRGIQRAEGNDDCFARNNPRECGQLNCLWREDCLAAVAL